MMIKATYAQSTIDRIQARLKALGLIHEAKAQLGLSEADYRAMVSAASRGKTSTSAELDSRGRAKLLRAMRAKGYKESSELSEIGQLRRQKRLADLGAIHMGKRDLAMPEADYRALVVASSDGKSRSCAHLNSKERQRVIKAMKAKGFKAPEAVEA